MAERTALMCLFLQARDDMVHTQEQHGITAENLVATLPEAGRYCEHKFNLSPWQMNLTLPPEPTKKGKGPSY